MSGQCKTCGGTGEFDTGGREPWGAWIPACCPDCDGSGKEKAVSESWLERQMAKAEKLMDTLPDDVLAWQHLHIQPARNQGKRMMSEIPNWAADLLKQADPNPTMPMLHYDTENWTLEVIWKLESYNVQRQDGVDKLIGIASGEMVGVVLHGVSIGTIESLGE